MPKRPMASRPRTTSHATGTQAARMSPPRSISLRWYFRTKASSRSLSSSCCRVIPWVSPLQGPRRALCTLKIRPDFPADFIMCSSGGTKSRRSFATHSNALVMRSLSNLLCRPAGILLILLGVMSSGSAQQVFLNEVDADRYTAPDSLEFVELFGAPDQSLDGHIVVFYRGRKRPDLQGVCRVRSRRFSDGQFRLLPLGQPAGGGSRH